MHHWLRSGISATGLAQVLSDHTDLNAYQTGRRSG